MYEVAPEPVQDTENELYVIEPLETLSGVGGAIGVVIVAGSEAIWPPLFTAVTTRV